MRSGYTVLLLVLAFSVSACDEVQEFFEKNINKGTHIGVQSCVDRNKNDIVSKENIRRLCVTEHQKNIYISNDVSGKGGYRIYGDDVSFSGHIENKSNKYIITEFKITVRHKNKGEAPEEGKMFSGVWVEPKEEERFKFLKDDLKFKPKKSRSEDGKHLFSWDVISVKGIEIKVD